MAYEDRLVQMYSHAQNFFTIDRQVVTAGAPLTSSVTWYVF
jgi:hypothetical protein